AQRAFKPGDHGRHIVARHYPQDSPNQGADHPDHRALDHENAHDGPRRTAEGTQDGNVRLLVGHHHHQGRDDIERRHRNDQDQQQADHGLFHADGSKQVSVAAGPVLGVVAARQRGHQVPGDTRSLEQVMQLQPHALHLPRFPTAQPRRIGHVYHGHGGIELGADLEDAHHMEALEPRKHSSGGDRGFGHDEGQLVAQLHTETASDQLTDDDAELPLAQILEAARLHVIAEDRHPLFGLGIDPRCQYRCDAAVMGQHALHLDEGRDPDYLRVLLQLRGKAAPVVDRLITVDAGMGHHAEDAGTQLAIKTIHDRQHQDHHQHPQRQPQHGYQRNEGNEVVSTLGPRVPQTDEKRQGSEHGIPAYLWDGPDEWLFGCTCYTETGPGKPARSDVMRPDNPPDVHAGYFQLQDRLAMDFRLTEPPGDTPSDNPDSPLFSMLGELQVLEHESQHLLRQIGERDRVLAACLKTFSKRIDLLAQA